MRREGRALILAAAAALLAGCIGPSSPGEAGDIATQRTTILHPNSTTEPAGQQNSSPTTGTPLANKSAGNESHFEPVWTQAARETVLPTGGGFVVLRVDLAAIEADEQGYQRVSIKSSNSTDKLVARVFRLSNDTLHASWMGLSGGGGTIGFYDMPPKGPASYIIVIHAVGESVRITIGAGDRMPTASIPASPLAVGAEGIFSWYEPSAFGLGDDDAHGVTVTRSVPTPGPVRTGELRIEATHKINRTSLHSAVIWPSGLDGRASFRLDQVLDGVSRTKANRSEQPDLAGSHPTPYVETDSRVHALAQDAAVVTSTIAMDEIVGVFIMTTPWDPADIGLSVGEPAR